MLRGMIGICLGTFVGHPQSHLSQIISESNPIHNCYIWDQGFCAAYRKPAVAKDSESSLARMSDQVTPTALVPGGGSGNAPSSGSGSASAESEDRGLHISLKQDKCKYTKVQMQELALQDNVQVELNQRVFQWKKDVDVRW